MLEEIRLSDLGVIAEAVLPIAPGFTVLTGETGAGKTMLLSALDLLCGGRADSGLVRPGAARAVVEGRIRFAPDDPAVLRAEDAGAECDEDGALVIRRTVSADGRSRAILGGAGVPNSVLDEVVGANVVVHGQADQQRLGTAAQARDILDNYGGAAVASARAVYVESFDAATDLTRRVAELESSSAEREADAERLRYALQRISDLDPQDGEDAALATSIHRLSHVESLAEAAESAHAYLAGADGADDGAGAQSLLAAAAQALSGVADADPALATLAERIGELAMLAGEVQLDLSAYSSELAADPDALERANERLSTLRRVAKAYSAQDPTAGGLRTWASGAARRLAEIDGSSENLDELRAALKHAEERLDRDAELLRAARTAAGERLSASVGTEFAGLALPGARLEVSVSPAEPAPHGADAVGFGFAAHPGAPLRPIGRGASGGELSRVMLALEVVLAGADPVPSMVFDEVDAGVGGQAAIEVGARLAALARHHQVLVVTHLAQVAAFADQHVRVRKGMGDGVGVSDVEVLTGEERIIELARMLAGQQESGAAREHARELLETAAHRRHSAG